MLDFKPEITISLSESLYPKDVIVRTCYALASEMHIEMSEISKERSFLVHIKRLTEPCQSDEETRVIFFRNLNDFCLRHAIEQKTKNIRDAIITSALLEAVPAQNEKS